MAQEQFSNDARTTLASAIEASDSTSITVTDASLFPVNPNFRIRIDDEIMIVTGIDSTADEVWTVTRGAEDTTAGTHSNGANVSHVLTAGALVQAVRNEYVYQESPSGELDGINKTFTLVNGFVSGSTRVFLNGLRQADGTGNDYLEASPNITFANAPLSSDVITVDYRIN